MKFIVDRNKVSHEKLGTELKPFEKYKLDDIDHYFTKFYGRWRAPHPKDSREFQLEYAKMLRRKSREDHKS